MKFVRLIFLLCACAIFAEQDQKAEFEKQGFVWIKNFFSAEQIALIRDLADEINTAAQNILMMADGAGKPPQYFLQYVPGLLIVVPEAKDPRQVCRTEDMLSCYPRLDSLIQGTVTAYITNLLGEPYVLFKDKLNFKWPGGGAFLPHQDFPAYDFFGPREHVTAMVCIDEATVENGCLQVASNWSELAGGRTILPYVEGGAAHGSIQKEYVEKIEWLKLETAPGDLVLFNSYLPHYSEPNKSKKARRAMFLTHNRLIEGYHKDAYYHVKRHDPENPVFHFATPTNARTK